MPPDLALSLTLIGSNYPCLELIFMVPKVFEPLKFDCSLKYTINLYHTKSKVMVNGREASQFNIEHMEITETILRNHRRRKV